MTSQFKKEIVRRESPRNTSWKTNGIWEVRKASQEVEFTAKEWTGATMGARLSRLRELCKWRPWGRKVPNIGKKKKRRREWGDNERQWEYSARSWRAGRDFITQNLVHPGLSWICVMSINNWMSLNSNTGAVRSLEWYFFLLIIPLDFLLFSLKTVHCLTMGFLLLASLLALKYVFPKAQV